MFRRKKNSSGAPHIKRRTAGTSNEISFDVLDAASSNYDDKGRNPREVKIKRPGKSVGVVSLLFSKVHFPHKSEKDGGPQSNSAVTVDSLTTNVQDGRGKNSEASVEIGVGNDGRPTKTRSEKRAEKAAAKAERRRSKSVQGKHGKSKSEKSPGINGGFGARSQKTDPENSWRAKNEPYSADAALAEVERRKAKRRKRRIRARITGAVVCAALLGVTGWLAYQRVLLTNDQDAQIKSLVSNISSVDENLVALDKLLLSPLDNESTQDWVTLNGKLKESKISLQVIADKANVLSESVNSSEMLSVTDQISVACNARMEMIDAGTAIFDEASKANDVSKSLQNLWDGVISADAKAREGAARLADASIDESTSLAIDAISEASNSFKDCLQKLDSIEESYQGLNLDAQREYLQARIDSLDYALATANALAARDKATAEEQAALYNSADQRAALLASSLPTTPSESVVSAYEANIADKESQYEQARRQATVADGVIRDYLGADSK